MSNRYTEQYEAPKCVAHYHDIPEYTVSLPPSPDPLALICAPGVVEQVRSRLHSGLNVSLDHDELDH